MITKLGLYVLVGLITNTILTAWILLYIYNKSKNDETGRIYKDLYREYTRLVVRNYNRMFFWKQKRSDGSCVDEPTVEQDANWFEDQLDAGFSVSTWIIVAIALVVLWPYEVIFNKGYTIPRLMAYAKKYDET